MFRKIMLPCLFVSVVSICQGQELEPNLRQAIFFGDVDLVRQRLAEGEDVNSVENGRSMLGWAAQAGNVDIVEVLLHSGADIDAIDNVGHTPLMRAVEVGQEEVVGVLISMGADLDVQASDGRSAVMMAAADGQLEILNQLIAAGADLDLVDEYGDTVVLQVVQYSADNLSEVLQALGSGGANLDYSNPVHTALYYAVQQGDATAVEALLAAGADPNAPTQDGGLPLLQAAYENDILELLLAAGADPRAADQYGETALFAAIDQDNLQGLEALIEAGADVNHKSEAGQTPLMRAEVQNREQAAEVLVSYGATRSGEAEEEPGQSDSALAGTPAGVDAELASMPKLGLSKVLPASGAGISYSSSASVAEVIEFYKSELGERGWSIGEEQTDNETYASISFVRGDETMTFTAGGDVWSDPPLTTVSLMPIGTANASKLPRYPGSTALYESAATAIYVTPDELAKVGSETLSLLREAGWDGDALVQSDDMQALELTDGETTLSVYIAVAPAQDNQTTIQYSVMKAGD